MATTNRTQSSVLNPLDALRLIQRKQQEGRAITRLAYLVVNTVENGADSPGELAQQLAAARVGLEVALEKLECVETDLDNLDSYLARNGARPNAKVVRLMREHQEIEAANLSGVRP